MWDVKFAMCGGCMVVYWFFFPPMSKALTDIGLLPLGSSAQQQPSRPSRPSPPTPQPSSPEADVAADDLLFLPTVASDLDPPLHT